MSHADTEPRTDDLDARWRKGALIFIGAALGFGVLFGVIIMPIVQGYRIGIDPFTAICRSLGIQTGTPAVTSPVSTAKAQPSTLVAWSPDLIRALGKPDPVAGAAVAENCAACHGARGLAADPQFPDLAGQSALAIYKQLSDYRSGARVHDAMTPMAQGLDDKQVLDVAAYFASLTRGVLDPTTAELVDPAIVQLVERGDPVRKLPACSSCHGRRAGGPLETPTLSGQSRVYLADQLRLYASGDRNNDVYRRMRSVASKLTEREIDLLSSFYATTLRQ